ncbi:MAG: four helix bundle protein [Candidatus Promineifilaceae bacterium]|nr:four helix bundle protein [Anaerolineaceae bacterium]
MNYQEWEKEMYPEITGDILWKAEAYRLALFVADIGWHDVTKLMQDKRTIKLSDQLYRALGSVGANVSEGYSRGTGKDRARFYEYALGSARESRGWYFNARHILGQTVVQHRIQLLTQIIRLLLTMVPQQRGNTLRESEIAYTVDGNTSEIDPANLPNLLDKIPLP